MPFTSSKPSGDENGPLACLCAMIAFAVDGPTPGRDSSAVASAVLMFTLPPEFFPEAAAPACVAPKGAAVVSTAAIACGTVGFVGLVRRGRVVGTTCRTADDPRGGTKT